MALSNSERQARYRERLKARASGAATVELVGKAVDEAVQALWTFFSRPGPGGEPWDDIAGCTSAGQFRDQLARDPAALIDACRGIAWLGEGLLDDEAAAIARVIALADALELNHAKPVVPANAGTSGRHADLL